MRLVHGIAHVSQDVDDLWVVRNSEMNASDAQPVRASMNRKSVLWGSCEDCCPRISMGQVSDVHEADESKLDNVVL
jgi:hypothetical protein